MDSTRVSEPYSKWSSEETLLLLQTRFAMMDQFNKPDTRKKNLWEEIAQQINEISTCQVDASTCDSKYRNLLNTYRKMKRRTLQGFTDVNWIYYNVIDEHLGDQSAYILPSRTLGSSLNIEENEVEEEVNNQINGHTDSCQIRKRKINDSIREIFEKKIKLDFTKDEVQQERKDNKWEERKYLEEKKILVLSSISNNIGKLSEKLQRERIRDILDEKMKSQNYQYEQRQINNDLRWQERKNLEERKIDILSSITDSIAKLAEKIA